MSSAEIDDTIVHNNAFNTSLQAELMAIENMSPKRKKDTAELESDKPMSETPIKQESKEAIATLESIEEGDDFLDRTVDAAAEKIKKFVDTLDGDFEHAEDRAIFMFGKIGTFVFRLLAATLHAGRSLPQISGDAIGYNLYVAKYAIEHGEYGIFLN